MEELNVISKKKSIEQQPIKKESTIHEIK